jgi:hypothetical protein
MDSEFFRIFGVISFTIGLVASVAVLAWYISGRAIKRYEAKRKASKVVRMPVRFDKKV